MASYVNRITRSTRVHLFTRLRGSRRPALLLGSVGACLLVAVTLVGWLTLRGGQTTSMDQQLARVILNEQRPDGFFVFSVQDKNPPVIAETYFAVASLHALGQRIPHTDQLTTSLRALENAANTAMRNGQPTLGPRELYEVFMIHRLIGLPLDAQTLAPYTSALQQLFAAKTPSHQYGALHDWYYAVESLQLVGLETPSERHNVQQVVSAVLDSKPSAHIPLIEVAYVVDASVSAHVGLTAPQVQTVGAMLRQSQASNGGFLTTNVSDMLTSYFALVTAHDLHLVDQVNLTALSHWMAAMRTPDGYRVTAGDSPNPLGTVYALSLRELLNGADVATTAR